MAPRGADAAYPPQHHRRESRAGGKKGALPKELGRLKLILQRGLDDTAPLWPDVRTTYGWVQRAAHILNNEDQHGEAMVKRRLQGLLGAMSQPRARAGLLTPAVEHFLKVSRSYWPGLFHCYSVPDLPRTNNDLEQFLGAYRYHERRATGRKMASPAVVLRGAVRLVACAATRIRPFTSEELAPDTVSAWQTLRRALETHRHQRTQRRRFRRDPVSYLAKLEADLLQLILPP